jgi:hypothetical protein
MSVSFSLSLSFFVGRFAQNYKKIYFKNYKNLCGSRSPPFDGSAMRDASGMVCHELVDLDNFLIQFSYNFEAEGRP